MLSGSDVPPDRISCAVPQRLVCVVVAACVTFALVSLNVTASAQAVNVAEASSNVPPGEVLYFEDHVAPLLEQHCAGCHNAEDHEGQLDLTSPAEL